jgi:hypothetical protein
VEAATLPSTASALKKRVISDAPYFGGMTLTAEEDEASDPRDADVLGTPAVATNAEGGVDAIEQAGLGWPGRTGLVDGGHDTAPAALREGCVQERRILTSAGHVSTRPVSR